MEDLYGFIENNRANPNFCSYVPLLYPVDGGCGASVGDAPVYKSCEDLTGFRKGEITEDGDIKLGSLWWPLVTFVRYNFSHLPFITQFLELFGDLSDDLKKWKGNFEVTPEEEVCMKVMFPTVIVTATMFTFGVYVSIKIMIAAVRTVLNAAITTFTLYNHTRDILENVLMGEEIVETLPQQASAPTTEEYESKEEKEKKEEQRNQDWLDKLSKDVEDLNKTKANPSNLTFNLW